MRLPRQSRATKIGDALSQLANQCLPNSDDTNANESISGRSHRAGWPSERWIDAVFVWDRDHRHAHCRRAYLRDVWRARGLLLRHRRRKARG